MAGEVGAILPGLDFNPDAKTVVEASRENTEADLVPQSSSVGMMRGVDSLSCMEEDEFWSIIAKARIAVGERADNRDPPDDPLPNALSDALVPLGHSRIVAFMVESCRLSDLAYTNSLWGAAYLIEGGCSDDSFMDFRDGLILQGRKTFERTLADPDSLAFLPLVQTMARGEGGWLAYESLSYPVEMAFMRAGGGDTYAFSQALSHALELLQPRPLEASGGDWDFDDDDAMRAHFPSLSNIFLLN